MSSCKKCTTVPCEDHQPRCRGCTAGCIECDPDYQPMTTPEKRGDTEALCERVENAARKMDKFGRDYDWGFDLPATLRELVRLVDEYPKCIDEMERQAQWRIHRALVQTVELARNSGYMCCEDSIADGIRANIPAIVRDVNGELDGSGGGGKPSVTDEAVAVPAAAPDPPTCKTTTTNTLSCAKCGGYIEPPFLCNCTPTFLDPPAEEDCGPRVGLTCCDPECGAQWDGYYDSNCPACGANGDTPLPDPPAETDKGELELNEYQAVNLLWCLDEIMEASSRNRKAFELNTGDWIGEIYWRLKELAPFTVEPNGYSDPPAETDTDALCRELREWCEGDTPERLSVQCRAADALETMVPMEDYQKLGREWGRERARAERLCDGILNLSVTMIDKEGGAQLDFLRALAAKEDRDEA